MKPLTHILDEKISQAMSKVSGKETCRAIVKLSTNPKFGDYQANGVMPLAKELKTNPRELAGKVVEQLDISDICEEPEVAGPGFINLRLKPGFLEQVLLEINSEGERLGVEEVEQPEKVVVDFSGPNIAKQMHVGHLRSTIIGDCICRMLEFLGHQVVRQNHIGDWGTQFGMLIAYLRETNPEVITDPESVEINNLEEFYRSAKARCDEDEEFARQARAEVTKLHEGDAETIKIWKHIVDESREHYQPIYNRLRVTLGSENERGESFYADMLGEVIKEFESKGLAEESEGAICVFLRGFENKEGQPLPLIIRKSDGAYLYATTDLAALRFRLNELEAKKIIYVTDARQSLHFEMVFEAARQIGWAGENVELSHITFGSVLGEDGKPFKTRSGESVKLKDLLDQAVERAKGVVEEKNPGLGDKQKQEIAEAVGIGAVKYADYSNNRTSDYIFSFDKMLAMDGNTAPYMQYAYARVKSIERKAQSKDVDIQTELSGINNLNLSRAAELDLAKHLARYSEAIRESGQEYKPNFLTNYLYELSQKFSVFYTECPVLRAGKDKRPTRLLLCDLTARTIRHGLDNLLGIRVVEKM